MSIILKIVPILLRRSRGFFYFMDYFYPEENRTARKEMGGIQIVLKNREDRDKMGVYRVWYGIKYYIGSSKNLFNRAVGMQTKLNRLIDDMELGSGSENKILKHLFMDLSVDCGIMELLYEAEDEIDLLSAEQMYLTEGIQDENCLNCAEKAVRPKEKKYYPITDAVKATTIESIKECVFHLIYLDKFVIVKGKSLVGSLKIISQAIEDFSKKDESEWPEDHLYTHFVKHILHEGLDYELFRVKIVLVTPDIVELLKTEQLELMEHMGNENCLNNAVDPYIPVWNEERQLYGWITKQQVMRFKKWLKKHKRQQLKPAKSDL